MNKTFLQKHIFIILIFILGPSLAFACINDVTINNDQTVDNGDGTCTYTVEIIINHTDGAASFQIFAVDGTVSNCDGGSCSSVTAGVGQTIIMATIDKDCDDEIDVWVRGRDGDNNLCGVEGARFSGDSGLPAELVNFEAITQDQSNKLMWRTASEENTSLFQVERSIDGNNFEIVGRVEASGNSIELNSYDFTDQYPLAQAYYRLQIIDIDGSFHYSDIIVVEREQSEIELVEVFPVPVAKGETTLIIRSKKEGPAFVDLFDLTGKVVFQDRIDLQNGVNRIVLSLPEQEGNTYFLTLYNGKERISKTILKSNMD